MDIILYSTHCMICEGVENLLKLKNINYELIDDIQTVQDVATQNNIENVPFAEIDGKIFETKELRQWIQNH